MADCNIQSSTDPTTSIPDTVHRTVLQSFGCKEKGFQDPDVMGRTSLPIMVLVPPLGQCFCLNPDLISSDCFLGDCFYLLRGKLAGSADPVALASGLCGCGYFRSSSLSCISSRSSSGLGTGVAARFAAFVVGVDSR